MILSTRYSEDLAMEIGHFLKMKTGMVEIKNFASGELYVRIKEELQEGPIIIGTTNTAENILELFLLCNAVAEMKRRFTLVIPYFGYARQNRIFEKGEAFSAEAMIQLFSICKPKKIYTVDIHKPILGVENIPTTEAFKDYFKNQNLVVISPDKGSKERAEVLAKELNTEYYVLEKERKDQKVSSITGNVNVKGKDILVLDDMIDTGSTIIKAIEFLKNQGAKQITVAATHLILSNDADQKIRKAGAKVVGTNTLKHSCENISLAKLIAEKIHP